jgi:hypothetical protein
MIENAMFSRVGSTLMLGTQPCGGVLFRAMSQHPLYDKRIWRSVLEFAGDDEPGEGAQRVPRFILSRFGVRSRLAT